MKNNNNMKDTLNEPVIVKRIPQKILIERLTFFYLDTICLVCI